MSAIVPWHPGYPLPMDICRGLRQNNTPNKAASPDVYVNEGALRSDVSTVSNLLVLGFVRRA